MTLRDHERPDRQWLTDLLETTRMALAEGDRPDGDLSVHDLARLKARAQRRNAALETLRERRPELVTAEAP